MGMTKWLRKQRAIRAAAALTASIWGASNTPASAWPKNIPYPDPRGITARLKIPTPRQSSEGYERQLVITAASPGIGLRNARISYLSNGQKKTIPVPIPRDYFNSESRNQFVLPLKLSQIPARFGELTLHADVFLDDFSYRSMNRYKVNEKGETVPVNKPVPANYVHLVIRRAGQQFPPVSVLKLHPFSIGRADFVGPGSFNSLDILSPDSKQKVNPQATNAAVLINLRDALGRRKQPKGRVYIDNVRLVTEKGEVHPAMGGKYRQIVTPYNFTSPRDEPTNYVFGCDFRHIPASQGKITFKAYVSVANCWSIPVSVRVR